MECVLYALMNRRGSEGKSPLKSRKGDSGMRDKRAAAARAASGGGGGGRGGMRWMRQKFVLCSHDKRMVNYRKNESGASCKKDAFAASRGCIVKLEEGSSRGWPGGERGRERGREEVRGEGRECWRSPWENDKRSLILESHLLCLKLWKMAELM